ncbi:site-2 protease family protein [Patescibacteria group bacterium]|nr:MAG: site-2 protease family protein [Patescibacteria group bacterium]
MLWYHRIKIMQEIDAVFSIVVLLMSVIIHEVSHGYAALALGDPTAKLDGRLTLNPLKHLDSIGSIFLPLLLFLSGSKFLIGWAKPVMINPYNFKNPRRDEALVALAGPVSNIVLALFFGILIRLGQTLSLPPSAVYILSMVVLVNLVLAFFNLVPIPPLDGSKILFAILPVRFGALRATLEKFGFVFVIIFAFFLWQFFAPIVFKTYSCVVGIIC